MVIVVRMVIVMVIGETSDGDNGDNGDGENGENGNGENGENGENGDGDNGDSVRGDGVGGHSNVANTLILFITSSCNNKILLIMVFPPHDNRPRADTGLNITPHKDQESTIQDSAFIVERWAVNGPSASD